MKLPSHQTAVTIASALAVVTLVGMLVGRPALPSFINPNLSYREASFIAWTIGMPAWFVIESWWEPTDVEALAKFRKDQEMAKYLWLVLGSIAAAIVGATLSYGPVEGS